MHLIYESEQFSVGKFTAIYQFIGTVGVVYQMMMVVIQNRLLDKISDHINSSALERNLFSFHLKTESVSNNIPGGNAIQYGKADKIVSPLSKLYACSIFLTVLIIETFAASQTVVNVIVNGMDLEESHVLAISSALPFKVNTWPKYVAAFMWTSSNQWAMGYMKFVVSILQFTLCFYVISDIRSLKNMAADFEEMRSVILLLHGYYSAACI